MQRSFLDVYRAGAPKATSHDFEAATRFYEANYDLIHIRSAAITAKSSGKPIDRAAIERLHSKAKATTP